MNLIQQFVNKKINNMTSKELLKYSKEYGVPIAGEQADKIVTLIQGKHINIYDVQERLQLLKQIAQVTSPATAQQINTLFQKLIK
ncbi:MULTISPECIES: DUF2624 domain-containing protein [unclassified Bacillus (in: firmicutes)]|uniref:DUF2624 domain-containing protein n=1 Tax=unclassified Bacillus (in: firmicutes) TaxID=185979 RepID=UPI0008E891B6|nr:MULTISPECIES: DUF2624 domain-containing protein [unclassified Bacillus (in: firmicutes)]SFI47041.1 Protein of unknown function [Bacillus sp. 71mf]SFS50306.1 Protein of unknown function [Bacillus sp. 103mf]